jgi:hypothetical protein
LLLKSARVGSHVEIFLIDVASRQFGRLRARKLFTTRFKFLPFFNGFNLVASLNIAVLSFILELLLINPIHWLPAFSLYVAVFRMWGRLFLPWRLRMGISRSAGFGAINVEIVKHVDTGASVLLFGTSVLGFKAHGAVIISVCMRLSNMLSVESDLLA